MTQVLVLLLALLIGFVAGLRSVTAPAVVAWAAFLSGLNLDHTWASWMGNIVTVVILSVLAVAELINDKLPKTPPRTATPVFAVRIILGGLAGAVIGTAWGYTWSALGAGVIGAVLGTLGGYQARRRLVTARGGHDLPIALLEDSVAVLGGFAIVAIAAAMVPQAL
ncbi:glycine zipper 2TM domain-containing protein [Mycobacterium riyadhense]|uniref:glycine zipper 2TM domain-containing protein n=1 Tax=Mycobacterium riyadhense TaxID=486698 RepID=UPI001959448F|nr:glycine zipper 2TM domain-containing protein [Mycobacterium riyadhense]